MKFLADMPISPKTVTYLRSLGHDVYRISERGLPKAKDRKIVDEDDRYRIRELPVY